MKPLFNPIPLPTYHLGSRPDYAYSFRRYYRKQTGSDCPAAHLPLIRALERQRQTQHYIRAALNTNDLAAEQIKTTLRIYLDYLRDHLKIRYDNPTTLIAAPSRQLAQEFTGKIPRSKAIITHSYRSKQPLRGYAIEMALLLNVHRLLPRSIPAYKRTDTFNERTFRLLNTIESDPGTVIIVAGNLTQPQHHLRQWYFRHLQLHDWQTILAHATDTHNLSIHPIPNISNHPYAIPIPYESLPPSTIAHHTLDASPPAAACQRHALMLTGGASPSEWQSNGSATAKPLPLMRCEAAPLPPHHLAAIFPFPLKTLEKIPA